MKWSLLIFPLLVTFNAFATAVPVIEEVKMQAENINQEMLVPEISSEVIGAYLDEQTGEVVIVGEVVTAPPQ